ncbi:hypothetical protein M0R04_08700 [Candidatus Dojkabacteria bacterium]|jgi:hypothetical protein|nr:hypothetical protein [Candidatus Dojkabacteria bacterium]
MEENKPETKIRRHARENLHECPVCKKKALRITYDNPFSDGMDTYHCLECGWS